VEQRTLGKSGLLVSVVGLGCNNFGGRTDLETSRKVIHKALDLGITLLDTADIYANKGGSETVLGEVLGDRRKDIVLATKFCGPMNEAGTLKGASRRYIMTAVEASLKRMKTDWIDLYQIHMPDPLTPMEETLRTLDDLVQAGKVRYVGCSNHKAWQVTEAEWISRRDGIERFISCQDEYSLIVRDAEKELIPAMLAYGIGLLPYFPLASGMLTGKYRRNAPMPEKARLSYVQNLADRYLTDANWQTVEKLTDFAAKRGKTILELAFSWLAGRPTVASVIAGATRPEQVEQNVTAASWKLTSEDMAEIDKLSGR
jgi:aryl-alcohol dehydrogenase-like predicted oxidoreductase